MFYTYGPVRSRRLGSSLGVDITPDRVCSFNCIYCEEGTNTNLLTVQRDKYAPIDRIISEVVSSVKKHTNLDFITFSGSGEPTLHKNLGEIIDSIKQETSTPIAVLTNSSMLIYPDVQQDLSNTDLIVPSLDTIDPLSFKKVNRPHKAIHPNDLMQGISQVVEKFSGKIFLEILLVSGYNDSDTELQELANFVNQLSIDSIHLNTVSRLTTEKYAQAITHNKLIQTANLFNKPVKIFS